MIDFTGPWEVFQDTQNPHTNREAFQLYTVAEDHKLLSVSGGMRILPDFSVADAPPPKVIVIPAQAGESQAVLEWIHESSRHADLTMSVCTGAFLLAKTGLLDGLSAATHHGEYKVFEVQYPNIRLERGKRFVDEGHVATSGGLSSGIDLALHVVERYFGLAVATAVADNMEYQGQGWLDPTSNAAYAVVATASPDHPLCAVCGMTADKTFQSKYKTKTYFFCSSDHQHTFETAPAKYLS